MFYAITRIVQYPNKVDLSCFTKVKMGKKREEEVKVKNYNTIKFIINEEGGRPHQLIPTTIS